MALQSKTIPWAFTTRTTALATNTTLGTATRHDFAAITIAMPELTRTIRSVKVIVTVRDAFTVGTTQAFTGWRIGIKNGATAFDDVDYSTVFTSGDHETLTIQRDVTAYFVTNFGSGATQTCQVGVAFSCASAASVNCITAELLVTYDYDNTAATQVRSVEIPIAGNNVNLSSSDLEIGCGAGASDAPANQIPILDGSGPFNPESGKSFKQIYLRVTATDNAANATTSFNLSVKLDSGGTYDARATVVQALVTGAQYRDLIDLTVAPYSITTNAVHALIMKTSLASTFEVISAVLVVTYTFTLSGTTREQHSVYVPLENERSGSGAQSTIAAAAGDTERYVAILDIQEPGTITFQQSGVVIYDHNPTGSGASSTSGASGQTTRSMNHANVTRSGPSIWTRRCDYGGSTWALTRGVNRLYYDSRCNVAGAMGGLTGYALVNYTADVPATGVGSGNRSCAYSLTSHPTPASGGSIISAEERLPSVPTSPWKMSGMFLNVGMRATSSTGAFSIQAERQTGEDSEDGWYNRTALATNYSVLGRREIILPITDWVRQSSFRSIGMSALATRRWRFSQFTVQNEWFGVAWLTLHTISFTVAGAITVGGVAVPNGGTVKIYADDGTTAELVTSVTTTGGTGSFTAQVTDSTRNHFATYDDGAGNKGWSGLGTPGTSSFDMVIDMFTPADRTLLTTLATDYTTARAAFLDVAISSRAPSSTAVSTAVLTPTRQALLDNLDTTVSSRAPSSTAVSTAVLTPTRQALLDNLDTTVSSRAPSATAVSTAVLTPTRQALLDNLDTTVSSRAPSSTAVSTAVLTPTRQALLDNLDVAVTTRAPSSTALSTAQWTNPRAANLDNLNVASSTLATASAVAALPTAGDIAALPTTGDIATIIAAIATRASETGLTSVADSITALPALINALEVETGIDLSGALRVILATVAGKLTVSGNTFAFRNVGDTKNVVVGTMSGENRVASTVDPAP